MWRVHYMFLNIIIVFKYHIPNIFSIVCDNNSQLNKKKFHLNTAYHKFTLLWFVVKTDQPLRAYFCLAWLFKIKKKHFNFETQYVYFMS